MLVLCLVLIRNDVHQFVLSVFKMNDTVNFEENFYVHFSGDQTRIFYSKYVILIVLGLVLKNIFSTIFTQWFKGRLFR